MAVKKGTVSPAKKKKKKKAGSGGASSTPLGGGKGKKKKQKTYTALNPPFDPRMRRIGSPLNLTSQMKRGWIQDEETMDMVNFLFNPSQLDLAHGVSPENTKSTLQGTKTDDVTSPFYTNSASTLTFKLLYDRTYELFSKPGTGAGTNLAHKFGVFADVLGWYRLLGLIEEEPTGWEDSLIVNAAQLRTSFLFVGPRLVYYGWVTNIGVTYSHWNQNMVPSRGAIDVSFQILPWQGKADIRKPGDPVEYKSDRGWGYQDLPEHGGIAPGATYNPYDYDGPDEIPGGGYVF